MSNPLSEEHKRKISESQKRRHLSRRNFLKGSAATALTAKAQVLKLPSSTVDKGRTLSNAISSTLDSKTLRDNPIITRRNFLKRAITKPLTSSTKETINNQRKLIGTFGKAVSDFVDPLQVAERSSGVKLSPLGKVLRKIIRVF